MNEPLTLETVLEGRLDGLLNPAAARRKALTLLPELVATRVIRRVDDTTRARWAARLTAELWPAVRRERGGRWDLGWAELTAGLALAIELLRGELPRELMAELQGTPADGAWQLARRPYQRFVLLVGAAVHVRRVLATRRDRVSGVRVEQALEWSVDGPDFRDRSHTLMLALLADDVLPADAGPVAATGELLSDGQRVGPVGGLVEKAEAWRRLYPDGLLVSAPPSDLDVRVWSALARTSTGSRDRGEPPWIVGATLREIAAKLKPTAASITSWDGTPLTGDALLAPRLSMHDTQRPKHSTGDPLLDAAWEASRAARSRGQRRGVVIHGSPGSGKSVLSMTLERRFALGALGVLGYCVRRSARELATDLERSPSRAWSAVLALRAPARAELLETLEQTRRLVPIVDGLDEVQPAQLQAIADWLRADHGWWIATSRPLRGVGVALPPAWELHLDDLQPYDARRLLAALGRDDLAEAALGRDDLADAALSARGQTATRAAMQELTRTPLHTALLARVVTSGEDPRRLEAHTLYARTFEALLDHACRSRRMTAADAALVRRLLSTVVGELAITWLQAASGLLEGAAIDAAFEDVELGPLDQARALEALAFGHLLVPAGVNWQFGHRTLAEWAAATALQRRVERRLRRVLDAPDRAPPRRRAEIELDVLGPFLEGNVLPGQGRWATLLRFYAPYVKEPRFFLDRLLGPAYAPTWRLPDRHRSRDDDTRPEHQILRAASSTEILSSWELAYELLRMCRWSRPAEARDAWAIAVRRWLLAKLEGSRRSTQEGVEALRGFAAAVGAHLPESLDGLIELAARTEAQRRRLTEDPLVLLPAIPAARASVLADLLEQGTRRQQLAVIEWHSEQGIEPSGAVLDRLARNLPDELERSVEPDERHVRSRLEAAVWKICLEHRREPPWVVVRRRFAAWPAHLGEALLQWFATTPAPEPWSTTRDDAYRQRRDVLAALLGHAAATHRRIVDILAALENGPGRERALGRLRYFFADSDDRSLLRSVEGIVSTLGWTKIESWEPREIEEESAAEAARAEVNRLYELRTRTSRLIRSLDGDALDAVVGELWELLRPEDPGRREILLGLDDREDMPRQVSAQALIRHRGLDWRLDRIRWTGDHIAELRERSQTGIGRSRYEAICALARTTGRDEVAELLDHLPSADDELASLVYEHISSRRRSGDVGAMLDVPDPSRLPLGDRAARDMPGWRAELLARLAGGDAEDAAMLAELAVRHEIREALPFLAQNLERGVPHDHRLVEAVALLATDRDEAVARVALRRALRDGWPDGRATWSHLPREDERDTTMAGVALARFLRVEDLDVLAEGSVSALRHPSLAAAIRSLGANAIHRLVASHGAAVRRVAELEATPDAALDLEAARDTDDLASLLPMRFPELEHARSQCSSLAETVIASLDPSATPAELVDVLFQIADGDVHHVYSTPGSLGSNFEEPGDQDWYADQLNEGLVQAAMRAIEDSLAQHPDDGSALRRLFRHPSEGIRKQAFELCADRAAPHEVAALAIEAIEGHVRANHTRWTGQTFGLLVAGQQDGVGSVHVELPDTLRSLIAAARRRLPPPSREVIQTLAAHSLPALRQLAAQWTSELGDDDWIALVLPMLEDVDAGVMQAALGALAALAPTRLDEWLASLRGETWTPAHDRELLAHLLPDGNDDNSALSRLMRRDDKEQASLLDRLRETTLVRLLARAADRVEAAHGPPAVRVDTPCFRDFPSLVERVLAAWSRPLGPTATEFCRRWLDHPVQSVREVGRRILASRGLLDTVRLEELLAGPVPADRFSGAECVVRMAMEPLRETALRVLRDALAGQLGDAADLQRRVLWALQGATAKFTDALVLVANHIPYEVLENCHPEVEELARDVARQVERWGEEGALAVLDLIDRGEVQNTDGFFGPLYRAAERHERVLAAIRGGAAQGRAASSELLGALTEGAFDRDLAGLARLLTDEIFPPGWPGSPGEAP